MDLVNQTLMMVFLCIIAGSSVTFPILFLVQKRKQHKEMVALLKDFFIQDRNLD